MAVGDGFHVDPTNAEQARAWDGRDGASWAAHAEHLERSTARYDSALFAAADLAPSSRVLDVGCGTGATSREAARRAERGDVLGVDLSSQMLELARGRAAREGLRNVRFEQADAQVHPFPARAFDVVISRAGAMFFGDPAAAFGNLTRALAPGGRLALLVWQETSQNEWIMTIRGALAAGRALPLPPADAPGPFSLGDPGRVRDLLASAGLGRVGLRDVREPLWLGETADDAQRLLVGLAAWMLEELDEAARRRALADLHAALASHQTDEGVLLGSAAWLVTAERR